METKNWMDFDEEEINSRADALIVEINKYDFLKINSADDLFSLRKFIYEQLSGGCFKSERHKLAYLLSKYESGCFNQELGITRRHFLDKELAKKWLMRMQGIFHPDKNIDIKSDLDFEKISEGINRAYGEMVGRK
ncbi:MAG: hypothetical protein ACN6O5_22000 [Achromobacter sp.]|uniref:hypothetical protein n=1 Tax=Achromobacter sp. TaxID=134375 RepID=UPI003CFD0160